MPRDAPITPLRQESIEELQLPPEPENTEVAFFNDNTEMTGPVDDASLGDTVQNFENSTETFELPLPPNVVNVAKPSEDQPTFLWFEYKTNQPKTPVLNWEIKRYKLNKDGRWSFKSSCIFHEKDTDKKKKSRMV